MNITYSKIKHTCAGILSVNLFGTN
jgi:hypothetical protein